MDIQRLEWHMENWAEFMRRPSHRLGYPSHSMCMISGGESTQDSFTVMCDEMDIQSAKQIDALIDSLPLNQQNAINHRWLHAVFKMRNYADSLSDAMDNLMTMAERRGMV